MTAGRYLGALLAVVCSSPLLISAGGMLASSAASNSAVRGFLGGLGLAILAAPFINRLNFLNTFAHEVDHMVLAAVTGGKMLEFVATERSGGHIRHQGAFTLPVTIAPYSMPLLAFTIAALSLLQGPVPTVAIASPIGTATGYHAVRALADLRLIFACGVAGSDLAPIGAVPTLAWIWLANVAALGSLLAYTGDGLWGLATFWVASWQETSEELQVLADVLANLVRLVITR